MSINTEDVSQIQGILSSDNNMQEDSTGTGPQGSTRNSINLYEAPSRPFKITMELPFFLIMLGLCLSGSVISNILLYRTCLHTLNHPETECAQFLVPGKKSNDTKALEVEVQKYATIVRMTFSVIEAFFPAILSLFLGVWSDIYGRKPLVVWPLFGICISSFLLVVYAVVNSLGPWWFVLTAIPFSLTGGYAAMFTGAFCYVSDITNNEDRSMRIALLEGVIFLGTILGTLTSPYLLELIGNVNLLLMTSAIYVLAYVYCNVWVAESINGAAKGSLCSVLDFLLVKEMIETCFKRRPNKGRKIIFSLILSNGLSILILYGLSNLDYLYTREKLQWSLETYSVFGTVDTLIMIVGLLLGVTFLQKILRVSDIDLALISYLSCITNYLFKTFALTSWHMYLGASVSLFRGLAGPLIRSILSKILPIEDLAKVFALMGVLDGVLPLFAPIIFNSLYSETINIFPGGIYMLSAILYVMCFVMLSTVKFYMWKYSPTTPYVALAS